MTTPNLNLQRLADHLDDCNRALGAVGPPGRQALGIISDQLRLWSDPRTTVALAVRAADWPFAIGPAVESAVRRWSTKTVGPRSAEAAVAFMSASKIDGEAAAVPAVLSRDDRIRAERKAGRTYSELGTLFGLSRGRTYAICNAKPKPAPPAPRTPTVAKVDPDIVEAIERMKDEGGV